MKITAVKYYFPGKKVTLFSYPENSICEGVLYLNSSNQATTESFTKLIRILAIFLLFVSLFSLTVTSLPILDGVYSLIKPTSKVTAEIKKDPNSYNNSFILSDSIEMSSNEFKITIPKISLESNIIPNVDSSNEATYKEELLKGIAHANGSYLPGQNGPMFLFSHSTDTLFNVEQFNAKFFALKDLEPGDEITINYKGVLYKYVAKEKKVINPMELDIIRNSNSDLILSTCFPPGTTWQRLVVFADSVETLKD